MENISIAILGRFNIIVDGESILPYIGNSSKSIALLKYLILNKGGSSSVYNLIDTFWAENEKSNNPESALKTMVSRIRTNLAKASPKLKNCILSESKSYSWNFDIPCDVDVFRFEVICRELKESTEFNEEIRNKYIEVLDIYGGDLSYSDFGEDWMAGRSMYLHHLYLQTVYSYIEKLKETEDYESLIHVCRIALDIDALDEQLNLELMTALKKGGRNSAALLQYRHITNAYYKRLGIDPSEKILGFYRDLVKSDFAAEADIKTIIEDLYDDDDNDEKGAFVCDYSIFRDVYKLQVRNLERYDNKMFITLVTISHSFDEEFEPMVLDGIMRELLKILHRCLRKGDTITKYSHAQYAMLLPMVSYAGGSMVIGRIKKMFYKKYTDNSVKINFQFRSTVNKDKN